MLQRLCFLLFPLFVFVFSLFAFFRAHVVEGPSGEKRKSKPHPDGRRKSSIKIRFFHLLSNNESLKVKAQCFIRSLPEKRCLCKKRDFRTRGGFLLPSAVFRTRGGFLLPSAVFRRCSLRTTVFNYYRSSGDMRSMRCDAMRWAKQH